MNKLSFEYKFPKRVSYILVTKNKAKYLKKAFTRYRSLVTSDDELIIVDGGSNDSTLEIIKKNKDLIDNFISEPDKNPTEAFNKGILISHGRYIKNLNDDDEIYPSAMETAIKVLDENKYIDLLVCGGVKQHGRTRFPFYVPEGTNYGMNAEDVFKYGACGVGFIIRRKSLSVGGLLKTSIVSDNNFALDCIEKGLNVRFCRIKLFKHPIFPHSTILVKKKDMDKESTALMKQYCSLRFYYSQRPKQIINNFVYKFPLLKFFLLPFSIIKTKGSKTQKIVWDGGLS